MNILEDEAKRILKKYNISVPKGKIASNPNEARDIADKLGHPVILKALIPFGGRGKGHFIENNLSGIRQANSPAEAYKIATEMLEKKLITKQTGHEGAIVNQILVEEKMPNIIKEFYLAISIIDELPVIMVTKYGGMDIESVENRQVVKERISPLYEIDDDVQERSLARALAHRLKLSQHSIIIESLVEIAFSLYWLFQENDCTLVEINPLGLTENYEFVALDAKIRIDDSALSRHPEFQSLIKEENSLESRAKKCGLGYVRIAGDIACLGNGAGITMASRDEIFKNHGSPGNFLDLGGGASPEQIECALKIICSDIRTKVIFINIFSGIFRLDVFVQILVDFMTKFDRKIPIVLRLEGANIGEAKRILDESRLTYFICEDMEDGIDKAINLSRRIFISEHWR